MVTQPFTKGMKRAGVSLNKFRGGVGALTRFLGPVALGAAIISAGRSIEMFNRAMKSSLAIMGAVSTALRKDMKQAALDMASVTVFSAKQAAKAYFFLASAGLSAAQSLAALPAVAKFAQAGMFNLALATDLLTDAQSALGLSVDDTADNLRNMTRVSDVLVKANTLANASVEQFSQALTTKAGAALRAMGKDVEEGVAVLAAFADQGVKGALAGTALAIVMRDLTTKAIQFKAQFKAAGIAVFDSAGEMRNIGDIVADLENAFAGMSDELKKSTLLQLGFSDKSLAFLTTLLGTSKAIKEYEKQLRNAAGTTQEIANNQMTTLQKATERLKTVFVKFGATGSDAMDELAAGVQAFADVIEGTIPVVTRFISSAISFFKRWGGAIANLIKILIGLRVAMFTIIVAQKAIAAGQAVILALQGPKGWIQLAVGVAAAGAALTAVNATFADITDNARAARIEYDQLAESFAGGTAKIMNAVNQAEKSLQDFNRTATVVFGTNDISLWTESAQRHLFDLADAVEAAEQEMRKAERTTKKLADALRKAAEETEAVAAALKKMQSDAARIIERNLTAKEREQRAIKEATKLFEKELLTAEQYRRELERIAKELERATKKAEDFRLVETPQLIEPKRTGEFSQVNSIARLALKGVTNPAQQRIDEFIKDSLKDIKPAIEEIRFMLREGLPIAWT